MSSPLASELPNELLDQLVREVDPLAAYGTTLASASLSALSSKPLVTFSMVCRRWRAAAFPSLFKRLILSEKSKKSTLDSDLLLFLSGNYHLAAAVQALCLYITDINIRTLCSLIDRNLLPSLRYLICDDGGKNADGPLTGEPEYTPSTTPIQQKCTLEVLRICGVSTADPSIASIRRTAALLGHCARIEYLEIRPPDLIWRRITTVTPIDDGTIAHIPCPQIQELNVKYFIPSCGVALFRAMNAPPRLTCLSLLNSNFAGLASLNELLCMFGATLGHLKLKFSWGWDPMPMAMVGVISPRGRIVDALRKGLTACTRLHGICIGVSIWTIWNHYSSASLGTQITEEALMIAIDLTSIVVSHTTGDIPSPGLKYLAFDVETSEHETEGELSTVVWDELRALCKRVRELRSMKVVLSPHETEQGSQRFRKRLREELSGFSEALVHGEEIEYVCEEAQCRWSKMRAFDDDSE